MNLDKIVCDCLNITNGMIKDAVNAGASTLAEVQEATGAATACGVCTDDVQRLIDYFATEEAKSPEKKDVIPDEVPRRDGPGGE